MQFDKIDALNVINEKQGADIASASTINLETATGNVVDVTGSVTITAVTLSEGHSRIVRFTGAPIVTHGASLILPNAKNITAAAGDYFRFVGYAAGVVRCNSYSPATTGLVTIADNANTSITPVITDGGTLIRTTSGSAVSFTIPTNASVPFPIGTVIAVFQSGAGQVTFSGASINSQAGYVKIRIQKASAAIIKVGTDNWDLVGDLAA